MMEEAPSSMDDLLVGLLMRNLPPRILLAEDDRAMRDLLAASLRGDGYDVIEAMNGIELLKQIHKIGSSMFEGQPEPLDLVITDVRMPGFSGLEVLECLRDSEWRLPVIVITAFGDANTHHRALELGAAEVLDKPFDLDKLREVVFRVVPPPPAC